VTVLGIVDFLQDLSFITAPRTGFLRCCTTIVTNMSVSVPDNVCKICNRAFSRKADCNRHRRLHYGIKPYACEVPGCGKRFAQFTALKTHRNVHTGSKPFTCGFAGCKSTFGDPSSCARHRREIHYPGEPFKCPFPGCTSRILRSSSFKVHLKKHGLDPSEYPGLSKRDQSPILVDVWQSTEPEGIQEGQVSSIGGSSCNEVVPLLGPPDSWDPFLSLQMDAVDPLIMQPELTSRVSCSSPLLVAPAPQIAPDYNAGYFLTPLRGSPGISSRYSSPMAPTPALTPESGLGFVGDVGVQLSPCYGTTQDWAASAWQDQGILFI